LASDILYRIAPGIVGFATSAVGLTLKETVEPFLEQVRRLIVRIEQLNASIEQLKMAAERDPIEGVKTAILHEIQVSNEPVFPGTIAIKHNVDYGIVLRAVKELKQAGVIE
jgi:hypothetical protein